MKEERTPVLEENEAGVLCVEEAVQRLLLALSAADITRVARLVEQIKQSDYRPILATAPQQVCMVCSESWRRSTRA
jgi:hypothetical protein